MRLLAWGDPGTAILWITILYWIGLILVTIALVTWYLRKSDRHDREDERPAE